MVICGSDIFEFSASKDMEKKNAIDFGRWKINEQESGVAFLNSQIQWNHALHKGKWQYGK